MFDPQNKVAQCLLHGANELCSGYTPGLAGAAKTQMPVAKAKRCLGFHYVRLFLVWLIEVVGDLRRYSLVSPRSRIRTDVMSLRRRRVSMAAGGSTKAVVAALIGNSAIAVAKFVGFFITRSSSMLAEAIHSVADSGNQALLLWGNKAAKKEADDEHQFGYGRERYYWAFVVALVLFLVGSGFALFEGVEKIRHPHEIENPTVAYVILSFAIVAEFFAFRTAVVASRPLKGDQSWWQFIKSTRVPELAVVLLEDFGAMVGLVIALISVWISVTFDAPIWDGIGTLAIGILLFCIAWVLIIEMRSLLLGEGAGEKEMESIRGAINGSPTVKSLINLRTQHLGPEELLVGAKVEFQAGLTTAELAAAVNEVEAAIRAVVPEARPIYVEPDLRAEV